MGGWIMIPKFRAWHKGLKKWCEPMYFTIEDWMSISFSSMGLSVCDEDNWFSVEYKDLELMQWTGLQDKNGKDIYEGDIVQWDTTKYTENDEKIIAPMRGVVVYQNGHPKVHFKDYYNDEPDIKDLYYYLEYILPDKNNPYGEDDSFYSDFQVIGDIYENPELIKTSTHE